MANIHLTSSSEKKGHDALHINSGKKSINGYVSIFKFVDKDTKQFVLFAPSFNMSSYGESYEKALEMMKESLYSLFESFFQLSQRELQTELLRMGWKKSFLRNKDFSKVTVDSIGSLQNFNAENNTVERFALVA